MTTAVIEAASGATDAKPNLIRMGVLQKRLGGTSRASIYRYMKAVPGFPKPRHIGASTFFIEREVDAWIESLAAPAHGAV